MTNNEDNFFPVATNQEDVNITKTDTTVDEEEDFLSGLIKQEPIDESYIFTEQWNQDIIRNPLWQEKIKEKVVQLQESEL